MVTRIKKRREARNLKIVKKKRKERGRNQKILNEKRKWIKRNKKKNLRNKIRIRMLMRMRMFKNWTKIRRKGENRAKKKKNSKNLIRKRIRLKIGVVKREGGKFPKAHQNRGKKVTKGIRKVLKDRLVNTKKKI